MVQTSSVSRRGISTNLKLAAAILALQLRCVRLVPRGSGSLCKLVLRSRGPALPPSEKFRGGGGGGSGRRVKLF